MSLDERREAIVRATLPLLLEHGANVSSRSVANAAGISEGTVFRVFTDKDELLRTCMSEAFRTDELRGRIHAISHDQPLPDRLVEVGLLVLEHMDQLGQLMQSLTASGYNIHQHRQEETDADRDKPSRFMQELSEACASLFLSDEQRMRLPYDQLIRMFLGQLTTARFDPSFHEDRRAALAQRVDIVLNGALISEKRLAEDSLAGAHSTGAP